MRRKMLMLAAPVLAALLLSGCGYAGPEKAVRQEMELIQKLDESAIKAFVSYEDIRLSHSSPLEVGEETTQAVKLFFKNFDFRIRSSSVSDDETKAVVELNITNLDAKLLAKDLCRAMIRLSVSEEGGAAPQGLASSFALMKQCLEENTYPLVTVPATVNLVKQNNAWVIQESSELEDALAGGLVSYLRDPYLLTPEEVLECTLQPFSGFSPEEWSNYLQLDDVFNIGSDLSADMDAAIAKQIARFFSYEIVGVTQDGDQASAQVQIQSLNLQSVMNQCRDHLLEYAQTTESIRATDAQITQIAAEYLLASLLSNDQSTSNTITVAMSNNGYTWEVLLDEHFADALLGGVDMATESLYPEEAAETADETAAEGESDT